MKYRGVVFWRHAFLVESVLTKMHANPCRLTPGDTAGFLDAVNRNDQREVIGNPHRADDIKGSAGLRQIANSAVDNCPTKRNFASFQNTASRRFALLIHRKPAPCWRHDAGYLQAVTP